MAVLPEQDRDELHSESMEKLSEKRIPTPTITKADVRTAINVIDDWLDTNAAAMNAALPTSVRNGLTVKAKWELFVRVLTRRWRAA